jgi:hypothetical protein
VDLFIRWADLIFKSAFKKKDLFRGIGCVPSWVDLPKFKKIKAMSQLGAQIAAFRNTLQERESQPTKRPAGLHLPPSNKIVFFMVFFRFLNF